MKIKIENEIPHSLKMKMKIATGWILKMKIYNVPCGKNENENPHIYSEK